MDANGFKETTEAAVTQRGADFDVGMQRFPTGDDVEFDQAQIDKLLGLDSSGGREKSGGMRELIDSSLVSHERLPMLEVAFDRMVRLLTSSLRKLTSDHVEVSLQAITSIRFGDYIRSIPLPALLAIIKVEPLDGYGLITIDSKLAYTMIDLLLGDKGGKQTPVEGRPYTSIERDIIQNIMKVFLADAENAFRPLTKVALSIDRLETNPRFVAICRPGNAALLVRLRIEIDNRGGQFALLLPYSTLEPIRDLLRQGYLGEKFGHDTIWEEHLAQELCCAEVEISAVLFEDAFPLRRIMALNVGDTLRLDIKPQKPVALKIGHVCLAYGQMGRVRNTIALKLSTFLRPSGR